MEGESSVRRNVVIVCSGLSEWRNPFRCAGAIETRAIQVALSRVVGRRAEVEPAGVLVEAGNVRHIGVKFGDECGRASVAGHPEGVPPAVALTEPDERSKVVEPPDGVHDFEPRLGLVPEDRFHGPARGIAQQKIVAVLQSIELLDGHCARVHPVEPGEVRLSRIAGRLHPHASGRRRRR